MEKERKKGTAPKNIKEQRKGEKTYQREGEKEGESGRRICQERRGVVVGMNQI